MTLRCGSILLAASLLATFPCAAETPAVEMFRVQLVMLKTGPDAAPPAPDDPRQAEHLAGLERLVREGKALVVGPIEADPTLRGLAVLDVETREAAEALLAADPWLKSGHLVAEYRTWYTAKKLFKPLTGAFLDVEPVTFALLVRPPDAPTYSSDELAEIQQAHLANIVKLAGTGELLIAGPFVEDTRLRGVLIFKSTDRAQIAQWVGADLAVQKKRLALEPYTWWVSKGVLPK